MQCVYFAATERAAKTPYCSLTDLDVGAVGPEPPHRTGVFCTAGLVLRGDVRMKLSVSFQMRILHAFIYLFVRRLLKLARRNFSFSLR